MLYKKTLTLFIPLLFVFAQSIAQMQWRVEAGLTPGIGLKSYTNDSLVFENRRNDPRMPVSMQATILATLKGGNEHLTFFGGFGWRFDQFSMNRKNFGESVSNLFAPNSKDSFALRNIKLESSSVIFPFGVEYAFDAKPKRRHHLAVRLSIVPGTRFATHAYNKTDSARQVMYPIDIEKVMDLYEQAVHKFSLSIMPQLFFSLRLWNPKTFMNLSVVPLGIDLINVHKTFINPGVNAMFTVSFRYGFSGKL